MCNLILVFTTLEKKILYHLLQNHKFAVHFLIRTILDQCIHHYLANYATTFMGK